MLNKNLSVQEKINKLVSLYDKDFLEEALKEAKYLVNQYPNLSLIYNIYGCINNSLGYWDQSLICFSKAIKLKPLYAEAYYNMGIALDCLGQLEESVFSYTKAIEIKPNYPTFYEGLIRLLTFYDPIKPNSNLCVKANKLLQKINYKYVPNKEISDDEVITFFQKCNNIILKNIKNLSLNETEIFRNNTIDLNCDRHFKVFNNFNVIPEYCFGCYKVQVEVKSVVDLFKLHFVFNNIKLQNNNPRKCMLEMRPEVTGSYKGYIYCFSLDEAKEIHNQLSYILTKKINNKVSIIVKRGCSEFAISYPEYKISNKKNSKEMKYKDEWKRKEKLIDSKLVNRNHSKIRVLRENLPGATVCDALIMSNWIVYAKIIGDLSYKKIIKKAPISLSLEKKLYGFLLQRKKNVTASPD